MNWVLVARAMQAVSFVAVVAFLVFAVVLDVPGLLTPGLVIVTLLVLAATGTQLLRFRAEARALAQLVASHPGQTVRPTSLREFPGLGRVEQTRVVLVVAGPDGLSFRDLHDAEVARVLAERILSLELAPLQPRQPVRPAILTTVDGTVRFTVGVTDDQRLDAIVAIRTALGRAAG
ncbi:MAG: hypothetical protein ACTHKX_06315 [Pseudolysinimonas sp.]